MFPPPALVPLVQSKFLAEYVNSQLRHLLLVVPCWMEADRGSFPQSVRQWWGQLECLCQGSTSSAGRSGLVGVLDRVYQTMPSLPLN